MNFFVTGVGGQLGHDVMNELLKRGHEGVGSDIQETYSGVADGSAVTKAPYVALDITDKEAVEKVITEVNPDAVIHCAAWTAVDMAEDDDKVAKVRAINAGGTQNIADVCKKLDCKMTYISTDYVFDGQGTEPWQPDCKDYKPLNVYGQTKLEGELAVSQTLEKYFIVRIAWVFGLNGKNFIKTIFLLFIPTIAIQVNAVLDKTMIGGFAISAAENGYYEQTEKIVRMALAVVTSLGTVMIPRIAKLFHDKKTEQMRQYIQQSYQFVWIIGIPIMMGVMAIADTFVPVFYGSGYDKIKILLPIYSLSVIPVALSNVTGCQFLIPTKKQNVYSAAVLSSTVVNVTLNSFLIPRFLSYGAASASVIAECVGCIIMIVYVEVKHLVDIKRVFSISLKKWVAGIVMFLCVKVSNEICNTSVLGLTFLILEGTIIYIITLLVLRDEFFCNMIKKLFCKVKGILAH